jgi:hypothetical protein
LNLGAVLSLLACTALLFVATTPRGEAVFSGEEKMDDVTKKGEPDGSRINLQEAWELDYWTNELGVSKGELEKVIRKVGNSTAAVRKELGVLGERQ